jgi:hypothetical protein
LFFLLSAEPRYLQRDKRAESKNIYHCGIKKYVIELTN